MIKKIHRSKLIFFFFSLMLSVLPEVNAGCLITLISASEQDSDGKIFQQKEVVSESEILQLNISLQTLLIKGYFEKCTPVVDKIIKKIGINKITDTKSLSESYYFVGVYYLFTKEYYESIKFLNLSIRLKESRNECDERYAKALYNVSVAYQRLGDFSKLEKYSMKSLEAEKKVFGESNPDLIGSYSTLIIAYIELQEYEKAINFANIALSIVNNNSDRVSPDITALIYNNLGVCFNRLADFSKAKIYLDKSESIYKKYNLSSDDNYITLLNSMAIAYRALGFVEKSNEYYEKGITLALSNNSSLAYNIINSYAIILANTGKALKGEALLRSALGRAESRFGEFSRSYFLVLNNYADYLREYKIDNNKSIECYEECIDYLNKNDQDILFKTSVYTGYSLSLTEAGESWKALETIQSLLFSDSLANQRTGTFNNPDIETIKPDIQSLRILKTKYKILWDIYRCSNDQKTLEAVSVTAELIVSLLEKVRINISEEDSRLVLGDRYRDSYLFAIRDFNLLYNKTADPKFLEKAFEFLEKSKVAGLLTSTRELKAVQFHIPSDIANLEKNLQRDISLTNAHIGEEIVKYEPDTALINIWKENLLEATKIRDSLILVFEKKYPGYYSIKYNTQVAKLKDIPKIIGRDRNYINYVFSDSMLYVFVANRKHQQLIALPVDSVFFKNIKIFRNLLSAPSPLDNARIAFEKYQSIGFELYKILIDPVRPYLISDKLLISPDNILSYIPFETIPTAAVSGEKILYRDISYLMDKFDISYTYSATFMAETFKSNHNRSNKTIVFAPDYPEPVDIQSVLMIRQAGIGRLPELPFARQEAEYVSDITGGKLFLNNNASESVFKKESGKYDIIHLAMHTILNDKEPMYSTLIFSPETDSIDDGYLKTYEVYGIPLKAKMVVLSSCNTGKGLLNSGEGILSLARGFIYSGSQSVIMSMWEIEDRSGTEIVKMFYKNLKKGSSKSGALRKARIEYLEKADQLRSHPYFWSALVIYGENTPLYYSRQTIITSSTIFVIIVAGLVIYFRKRIYS